MILKSLLTTEIVLVTLQAFLSTCISNCAHCTLPNLSGLSWLTTDSGYQMLCGPNNNSVLYLELNPHHAKKATI